MTSATQSLFLNAVPLLVLAVAYLASAAILALPVWSAPERPPLRALAPLLTFPCVAACAAILGAFVIAHGKPLAGHLWPSLVATLIALAPALLVLVRPRERLVLDLAQRDPAATKALHLRDREVEAMRRISTALGRTGGPEAIAEILLEEVVSVFELDFAGVALVGDDGAQATGIAARGAGRDLSWWRELRLDLTKEPSGIASAAFEAASFPVYDVESSPIVSRRLVEAVGARSAAFVPLVADARVIAVLVVATTQAPRLFDDEELALMEALGGEAALALARSRSAADLAEALERERLLATIARRVRSELDVDTILRIAVQETGRALSLSRCFVRLVGERDEGQLAAEWRAEGFDPIPDATQLPGANLAARRGRTVAFPDVERAEDLDEAAAGNRQTLLAMRTRAVLATPVTVFDHTVGVFGLHRPEPARWSDADVALAEAVALELGLAIHIARLLTENQERVEQQEALFDAARVVTGELHLDLVLQRLVDEVAQLLKADGADCFLLDEGRGVLRCAAVHGLSPDLVGFEFPLERGLAGEAIREGKPVLSNDYAHVRAPVPHAAFSDFAAVLSAPMTWSGRTRGVLGVGVCDPARQFGEADLSLLDGFASLASLALRNAESFEQSERQARVERGFYQIASVLGEPLSLSETLDAVAEAAAVALGGQFAAVLGPVGERLELAGSFQLPSGLRAVLQERPPTPSDALGAATRAGHVLAASEIEDDPRFDAETRASILGEGCRSVLAVPVKAPRTEQNGLVLVYFRPGRAFSDDDLDVAGHLARAARGALERSELFETERKSRALSQELARIGSAVATELDPATVLEEVVERAPALLGADAASIVVAGDGALVFAATSGGIATAAPGTRLIETAAPAADVLAAKAPVAHTDVAQAEVRHADPILDSGFRSYLGVPVAFPEGPAVLAVYGRAPRAWRPEEVDVLVGLAASAGAALENADLYQRVAEEKERSVAILANVADGIVALDRDGKVVLWNTSAERVTGVLASEAVGRTPLQVLHRRLESDGTSASGDRLVSITRGSEEVWLSVTEAVMRDPVGTVSGRILAFRDISADRAVEQLKSDFVATVSHELRTPLTSIYGFAETLLRNDIAFGDEERRTFLGYIASESERLTRIVDALLNVARLDSGDLAVQVASTDVRAVVAEVLAGVDGGSNGHRFVVELPTEPLDAEADRDKLRQVLAQLVDNAVRYSPDGGTVTVEGRRTDAAVELLVTDEGVGIPFAEQARIFRKFYRGEASLRAAPGGAGLGLFIAEGLVRAMGGQLTVSSAEGSGSRFSVALRSAQRDDPAATENRKDGV